MADNNPNENYTHGEITYCIYCVYLQLRRAHQERAREVREYRDELFNILDTFYERRVACGFWSDRGISDLIKSLHSLVIRMDESDLSRRA